MSSADTGVMVPADPAGRRSSSALGRAVVGDALRGVDPVGALGAERETSWRRGYLVHLRRVLEAGLVSRQSATTVAVDGLHAVHRRMRYRRSDGREEPLDAMRHDTTKPPLSTAQVRGTGEPEDGLSLPLHGERLSGDALAGRLDLWAAAGVLEPSAADRVRTVLAHPEWLRLDGQVVVALGACAEMGPVQAPAAVGRPRGSRRRTTSGAVGAPVGNRS